MERERDKAADIEGKVTRNRARSEPIVSISSRRMDKVFHLCCRAVMRKVLAACVVGCLFGCGSKNQAADDTTSADAIKTPATVEQAARVLDLSTFPLMDGAKSLESRHVANLFYVAPGDLKKALEFNRKALVAQGWKELPNSSVTDQSASAMFSRNGFVVFVSVTPNGDRRVGQAAKYRQRKTRQAPGSSERKASLCRRPHRDV